MERRCENINAFFRFSRKNLNKWLRGQIAALLGAQTLAYLDDMSRVFCAVRLALYPARSLIAAYC